MDPVYPENIAESLSNPANTGNVCEANGKGKAVSFECGTFVRISICVREGVIEDIRFRSNGCGYALAAADLLCSMIRGRSLTGLHGSYKADVVRSIEKSLCGPDEFPADRDHCVVLVVDAFKNALAEHRRSIIDEFSGEKPLVCTCFGVTEEAVADLAASRRAVTVEIVGERTNAGTGCGSCRMIIQEILDGHSDGI